jgi:hypothetical protein
MLVLNLQDYPMDKYGALSATQVQVNHTLRKLQMPNDVCVMGQLKINPYIPCVKITTWDINDNEISVALDTETARQLKEKLKEFFQDEK